MTNKEKNVRNVDYIDYDEAAKRAKGYYGEDTPETRIAYSSFLDGCEWKEQQMIKKACEYIAEHFYYHPHTCMVGSDEFKNVGDFLERFKIEMRGGE